MSQEQGDVDGASFVLSGMQGPLDAHGCGDRGEMRISWKAWATIILGGSLLAASAGLQERLLASLGGLLLVVPLSFNSSLARSRSNGRLDDRVAGLLAGTVVGATVTSMALFVVPTWSGLAVSLLVVSFVVGGWGVLENPESDTKEAWRRVRVVLEVGFVAVFAFGLAQVALPLTSARMDAWILTARVEYEGACILFGIVSLSLSVTATLTAQKRLRRMRYAAALVCTVLGGRLLLT